MEPLRDIKAGVFKSGSRAGMTAAIALFIAMPLRAEAEGLRVSGYGWTQALSSVTPMYKGQANFDYNPLFQVGGMLFLDNNPSERWSLHLGLGVGFGNNAMKKTLKDTTGGVKSYTNPNSIGLGMGGFLHEANVSYNLPTYSLKVGKFHYNYSSYNTNMGLYLLRGPVYPGFLYSGFDEIPALTKTGFLSTWSPSSSIKWDVLATFETDFKPYMDLNLSSVLTFSAGPIELGTGFEAQRLVELNPCITSPSKDDVSECLGGETGSVYAGPDADLYKAPFIIYDTTGPGADTAVHTYSLAGTKVMVRGAVDFNKMISGYSGSPKDNKIYFEAALIGVKDYPLIYEKKGERIPVLFGANLPTFGLLDLFAVEVEYYNAPYQNDPYKLVGAYDVFKFAEANTINYAMSPIPPSNKAQHEHLYNANEDFDPKKDNWKWSLYLTKRAMERITFKCQLASDHWRVPNNNLVQYEAAANPGQFYGSLKVEYGL